MKKTFSLFSLSLTHYLPLVACLLLTACSPDVALVDELQQSVASGKSNFILSYRFLENDQPVRTLQYNYRSNKQYFSVKDVVTSDEGKQVTISYLSLKNGDVIRNQKAFDDEGNQYEVGITEKYSNIMASYVNVELNYLQDLTSGKYDNVIKNEDSKSYLFSVTLEDGNAIYVKLAKDGQHFISKQTTSVTGSTLVQFEIQH